MAASVIDFVRLDDVRGLHLLIALSGGADSVALAYLLAQKCEEYSLTLTAAHFHHGIRGKDADADADFCREICRKLEIELIEGRADLPHIAAAQGIGLETAAREERYRFLRKARQTCGADCIALAHHMDDQAETILMHLFRGAGTDGIAGMKRHSGDLFRPLLEYSKAELTQILLDRGISWREDMTNRIADNPRNAIRLNVLPEIEKSYPSAADAIVRHGQIAERENAYLARLAEGFLAERLQRGPYGLRIAMVPPPEEVLLRRAIRSVCGRGLEASKLDALIALSGQSRGKLEISGKLAAEKTPGWLYFLPKGVQKAAQQELTIPGETILEGNCRVRIETGRFEIDRTGSGIEILDADALQGAVLRTRMEGDRIHPLGAPGSRLLSDYLTDKKVDRPLRDHLPVIAVGRRILWVGGLGIAEDAAVHSTTSRMLRVTWKNITSEKGPEVQL